jgi:hypothetical protein
MTHDHNPPLQPLFRAALAFSLGLWTGLRAWRPPSWWVIALVAFALAASWYLPKRAWMAKALSLGAWFLLGAFLIQIHSQPLDQSQPDAPSILTLADGRPLTLTAHVTREGYARAAGPKSVRDSIDVETEEIESMGESWPVRTGARLSIYEKVEEDRAIGSSGHRVIEGQDPRGFNDPMTRSPDIYLWSSASHSRQAASGTQLPQSWSFRLRRLSARQRHQRTRIGGGDGY